MAEAAAVAASSPTGGSSGCGGKDHGREEEEATATVCRICFSGAEAGDLVQPCHCKGTQASVHEACLSRWRRLQSLQGKAAAAARCEICGARYTTELAQPSRVTFMEFVRVVSETLVGLIYYSISSRSPGPLIVMVLLWLRLGILQALAMALFSILATVLVLYSLSLRLSVLGAGQDLRLGLTSFGPPVEGLSSGMLLVSIHAGGPFQRTVLYVIEHSDRGSLAVILNTATAEPYLENAEVPFWVSERSGGPIPRGLNLIHNVEGVPGAERLLRGRRVFLSSFANLAMGMSVMRAVVKRRQHREAPVQAAGATLAVHNVAVIRGCSSWGEHQLEGEVRRGAWGWIKPEHVREEDILDMDVGHLGSLWELLVESPQLEVFTG